MWEALDSWSTWKNCTANHETSVLRSQQHKEGGSLTQIQTQTWSLSSLPALERMTAPSQTLTLDRSTLEWVKVALLRSTERKSCPGLSWTRLFTLEAWKKVDITSKGAGATEVSLSMLLTQRRGQLSIQIGEWPFECLEVRIFGNRVGTASQQAQTLTF